MLAVLRDYARLYRPSGWLFEGQERGKHLTDRTAQRVFEMACEKAGIVKNVSIHGKITLSKSGSAQRCSRNVIGVP